MNRISTNLTNDNLQYYIRQRQIELNASQNRMAAQTNILNLRDDPIGAAHSTRYLSYLTRLERFSNNIQNSVSHYHTTEGHMRHAVDILQEIRQIAVIGSNSFYSPDDLKAMGTTVDELLKEFINNANATDAEGSTIFSGTRTSNLPYRVVEGYSPGTGRAMIQEVEYIGNLGTQKAEIADGQYIELNFPGNKIFWAERQQLYAQNNALDYVVQQDSLISINGENIQLREGDNIYTIIARINDSTAGVQASLDPVDNGLVLETTSARQLWLSDDNGSVLQELGIIENGDLHPPQNIARGTRLFGGSSFDAIIRLRNDLFQGDVTDIGGNDLRGIDSALTTILSGLGDLGAKTSRMELALKRTEKEIGDVSANNSRISDIDITEAITEFSMLELTHRAALSVTAKIIQPTLLDFLR